MVSLLRLFRRRQLLDLRTGFRNALFRSVVVLTPAVSGVLVAGNAATIT